MLFRSDAASITSVDSLYTPGDGSTLLLLDGSVTIYPCESPISAGTFTVSRVSRAFRLIALCMVAACRAADEEYEYEDEPAPAPVTPAPARPASRLGSLLSPRGRAPAARKAAPATTTTAKPVEPVVEEEVEEGEEVLEEEEEEVAQTTTTEASKKLRGGVRPFRSNEDLLAALKRRRAQVGTASHTREPSTTQASAEPTTPKSKSSSSGRSRNGASDASSKAPTRGRFGSSRGNKPVQEEVEETQQEEVQVKPKPYRRG